VAAPLLATHDHDGRGVARKLLDGTDSDQRLAGVSRLARLPGERGKEALLELLAPTAPGANDPRVALAVVRALAPWAGEVDVGKGLTAYVERRANALNDDPNYGNVLFGTALRLARKTNDIDVQRRLLALHSTGSPLLRTALELAFADAPPSPAVFGHGTPDGGLWTFEPPPAENIDFRGGRRDPVPALVGGLPVPTLIALARSGDLRAVETLYARLIGRKSEGVAPKKPESKATGAKATKPEAPEKTPEKTKKLEPVLEHEALAAVLDALADADDGRALPLAKAQLTSEDGNVVAAAVRVLVRLGAKERFSAVEQIIASENFGRLGLQLAPAAPTAKTVAATIARRDSPADPEERELARAALAKIDAPKAAESLAKHALDLRDPASRVDTPGLDDALALGRNPSPVVDERIGELAKKNDALAFVAYASAALTRGTTPEGFATFLEAGAASKDPARRQRAAFATVALLGSSGTRLSGSDDGPTRAGALAALGRTERGRSASISGFSNEKRERALRAMSVFPDAPLAAEGWASGAERDDLAALGTALRTGTRFQKVHLSLGLARATLPAATGLLARAALDETDVVVRRALVRALAARPETTAPVRAEALATLAGTDPDREIRAVATAAREGAPLPEAPRGLRRLVVLRITGEADGATAKLPLSRFRALWVDGRGRARPMSFDDDGFAFAVTDDDGDGTLLLAPATESP
jgi:hypothetical protein